jgi:hypothetical protein
MLRRPPSAATPDPEPPSGSHRTCCSRVSTSFDGSAPTPMIWTSHQLCDRPDQLHPPLEDELRSFIGRSGPSERLQPLDPKADHHVGRSCGDAHRHPVGRITCGAFKPRERAFRAEIGSAQSSQAISARGSGVYEQYRPVRIVEER